MKKLLLMILTLSFLVCIVSCADETFVMKGEFEIEELKISDNTENENSEITFKMKNTTEKSISSMNFLLITYDEDNILVQEKKLNCDFDSWASGEAKDFTETLYSTAIVKAELYVYSVVFSDGSTFGDAEADEERIQTLCRSFSVTKEKTEE